MKIVAKIRAFYNGSIVKPGEKITIKGEQCPSWAYEIKTEKDKKTEDNQNNKKEEDKKVEENNNITTEPENDVKKEDVDLFEGKTDEELNQIADELITKAVEKNIVIDTQNKTIKSIIVELQEKLKEVKE